MASILALDPVCDAVIAKLRWTVALIARFQAVDGDLRMYPDAGGDAPERPEYPYLQVEAGGETPFNTLGPDPDSPKWGGTASVRVRIASQSSSDQEVRQLTSLVKQALDGQPLTVPGFGSVAVSFVTVVPIEDLVAGVTTREWLSEFDVFVHQS